MRRMRHVLAATAFAALGTLWRLPRRLSSPPARRVRVALAADAVACGSSLVLHHRCR